MENSVYGKIAITGPGIWFTIFAMAAKAQTDADKRFFETYITKIQISFKCTCKKHFKEYLETHSFSGYRGMIDYKGRDYGYFKYVWDFKKSVDARIGKNNSEFTFDQAFDYFYYDTDNEQGEQKARHHHRHHHKEKQYCSNCGEHSDDDNWDNQPAFVKYQKRPSNQPRNTGIIKFVSRKYE